MLLITLISPKVVLIFRRRRVLFILVAASLFFKAQISCAQTFYTAGPEALGEAGRAANEAVDNQFLNPAALAFSSGSNIGYVFQEARPTMENPTNDDALIITDNDPQKIAAGGLAYVYKRSSFPDHTVIDQDYSLDIAARIVPTISFGVQVHHYLEQNSLTGGFSTNNMTLGLLFVPKPFLALALVSYDVIDDNHLVPVIAVGSHLIIMELLRLRADATKPMKNNSNNSGTLNLGMEIDAGSGFLLRTGGIWDTYNQQTFWTAGLAWEGPRLNVAYAYKDNVNVAGDVEHVFQAWLNF